uniref:Cellular repressor of E1A-stimulated genes 2 n=1 Tax=Salmo trutta TaxID=8032 RepID=A0A673XJI9_SALTR
SNDKHKESVKSKTKDAAPVSSASRVFSYQMEAMPVPPHQETARTARYMESSISTSFPFTSLTFSEQMYDPEDPRCDRLTLTGKMVEVEFAKEAMFSRHPVMKKWPVGHNWFLMKLQLTQVWLQDWVGGVSLIPLEDYFKATPY